MMMTFINGRSQLIVDAVVVLIKADMSVSCSKLLYEVRHLTVLL